MKIIYYIIAFILGMGLTLQVGVNGRLKVGLESPMLAAIASFVIGLIGLVIAYTIMLSTRTETVPAIGDVRQTAWWMWTGGLIGAIYIFSVTIIPSKIGFGSTFSLVVAGQVLIAVLFDHFGLLGSTIHTINPMRVLGVLLLIIAVIIIQKS